MSEHLIRAGVVAANLAALLRDANGEADAVQSLLLVPMIERARGLRVDIDALVAAVAPRTAVEATPGYRVTLSHASNPDIKGGYWNGEPEEGATTVDATSIQDAARLCREYIERNDLGAGNWTGGNVYQDGKQVARISYNGRAWAMDGKEIDHA